MMQKNGNIVGHVLRESGTKTTLKGAYQQEATV